MAPRLMVCTAILALAFAGEGRSADELKSGLPVGSGLRGAFYPQFVTGPGAGQRNCPV